MKACIEVESVCHDVQVILRRRTRDSKQQVIN